MTSISDLPNDILSDIASHLHQFDLINLGQTCEALNFVCRQQLYTNIYITEKDFPVIECISEEPDVSNSFHNWSVLNYTNQSVPRLKLFERSMKDNPKLTLLLKRIITDSLKFALFKLKFWSKNFLQGSNLSEIYIGNIPLVHFQLFFDDLFAVYLSQDIISNLTILQLRHLQDLNDIIKCIDIETTHVTAISFILAEIKSLDLAVDDKEKVLRLFQRLSKLHISSVHNLGMNFLQRIKADLGDDIFQVNELLISHLHGQLSSRSRFDFSREYDPTRERKLDFGLIRGLFKLEYLQNFELKIGCNHISCPIPRQNISFDESTNTGCDCLVSFFGVFHNSLRVMTRLSRLSISKIGQSIVINPCSYYIFKLQLVRLFLTPLNTLRTLVLDTDAELHPYLDFNYIEGPIFNNMVSTFINQNDILANLIRGIQNISLPDYFLSVHIWDRAQKDNASCRCTDCTTAEASMNNFITTNKKIHSYVDPTSIKSSEEFYFDLVYTVLSQSTHHPHLDSIPRYLVMSHITRPPMRLHDYFKHNLRPPTVPPCTCTGQEYLLYKSYLVHQLQASLSCRFPGSTLTLNGLSIVALAPKVT
ncbi:unnamed protein product [Debaryomyces fabryi]|nr:unnamed protein product [Debaryomyces fabryi]